MPAFGGFETHSICRSDSKASNEIAPPYHLVGAAEERDRHIDAKCFGGFEIQNQFDPKRLLDRQIGWLLALENATGIDADQMKRVRET